MFFRPTVWLVLALCYIGIMASQTRMIDSAHSDTDVKETYQNQEFTQTPKMRNTKEVQESQEMHELQQDRDLSLIHI